MKFKEPLVLVLAGQIVVLAAAVGFMAARAGQTEAPRKHVQKVVEEAEPEAPQLHMKLTPPPPPVAESGDWAQFPAKDGPGAEPGKLQEPGKAAHAAAEAPSKEAPAKEVAAKEAPRAPEVAATFEELVSGLVAGNARFVEGVTRQRDVVALRQSLGHAERADAVVVTCTDSRIVPELLFDQPLGTFAVVRVPGAQLDEASARAVDDSVKRLHAKAVLVLGHLGCHHVEQALDGAGKKVIARPTSLTTALGGLKAGLEAEALDEAASVASVSFSTRELRRRSKVLGRSNEVAVLRLIYAPASGSVRWLDAEQEPEPTPEPAPRNGRR